MEMVSGVRDTIKANTNINFSVSQQCSWRLNRIRVQETPCVITESIGCVQTAARSISAPAWGTVRPIAGLSFALGFSFIVFSFCAFTLPFIALGFALAFAPAFRSRALEDRCRIVHQIRGRCRAPGGIQRSSASFRVRMRSPKSVIRMVRIRSCWLQHQSVLLHWTCRCTVVASSDRPRPA